MRRNNLAKFKPFRTRLLKTSNSIERTFQRILEFRVLRTDEAGEERFVGREAR